MRAKEQNLGDKFAYTVGEKHPGKEAANPEVQQSLLVAVGLGAVYLISEPKFVTMWHGKVMYIKHSDG